MEQHWEALIDLSVGGQSCKKLRMLTWKKGLLLYLVGLAGGMTGIVAV